MDQGRLMEHLGGGNFSSNDTLGFPSGSLLSLSLLRYMGALPRPNEVLALRLEILGEKKLFLLRLLG